MKDLRTHLQDINGNVYRFPHFTQNSSPTTHSVALLFQFRLKLKVDDI